MPRYLTPVVSFVVLVHLSSLWLTAFHPAYADKAEQEASTTALVFNCKQREVLFLALPLPFLTRNFTGAHQNTLEYIPVLLTV
jgi:hypothetical protein